MRAPTNSFPIPSYLSAQGIDWAPVAYLNCSNTQRISFWSAAQSPLVYTSCIHTIPWQAVPVSASNMQNNLPLFALNQD